MGTERRRARNAWNSNLRLALVANVALELHCGAHTKTRVHLVTSWLMFWSSRLARSIARVSCLSERWPAKLGRSTFAMCSTDSTLLAFDFPIDKLRCKDSYFHRPMSCTQAACSAGKLERCSDLGPSTLSTSSLARIPKELDINRRLYQASSCSSSDVHAEAAATARFAGLAQSTAGSDQDRAQPPLLGKRVKFADGPLLSSSDGHPLHEGQVAAPAPSCKSNDDADDEESCMPEALTPSSILAMERELGDDFQSANAHSLVRLKRRCAVDVLSSGAQRQA